MILADFIALGLIIVSILVGYVQGFGKQLKTITSGIFGIIISVIVCYFIYGFVLNLEFVQNLLLDFRQALKDKGSVITNFLLTIHIDSIVYALALFIIVQVLRIIIISIIKDTFESKNTLMKVINKTFGAILGLVILVALVLLVFQIIYWIKGTDSSVYEYLKGSLIRLDYLYENNPLNVLVEFYDKAKAIVSDII